MISPFHRSLTGYMTGDLQVSLLPSPSVISVSFHPFATCSPIIFNKLIMASDTTALSVPFNMSTKPSSGDELNASRRVVDNSNFDAPHIATLLTPKASKAPLQFTSSVSRRGMALVDDDEVADEA